MKTYKLVISTPLVNAFEGEVMFLSVRGAEGDLAVMADHVPFITTVRPCTCKIILEDDTERYGELESGLLTVGEGEITLLSDSFRWQ